MQKKLVLSQLPKTWIFDVDGTLVTHNGYKTSTGDRLLNGVREFISKIPLSDKIIFMTARKSSQKEDMEKFFIRENIRYDLIITDIPQGERIIFNDKKPSGLPMAYALNVERDSGIELEVCIDKSL